MRKPCNHACQGPRTAGSSEALSVSTGGRSANRASFQDGFRNLGVRRVVRCERLEARERLQPQVLSLAKELARGVQDEDLAPLLALSRHRRGLEHHHTKLRLGQASEHSLSAGRSREITSCSEEQAKHQREIQQQLFSDAKLASMAIAPHPASNSSSALK